jgi:hypothetical protein
VTLRHALGALVAFALAAVGAGVGACALDFDRFEPVDASAPPRADVSNEPSPGDASADVTVTGPEDAEMADGGADGGDAGTADVDALADGSQEAGPCTPSPSCLTSARTCGTGCAQQEQQCAMRCGGGACRSSCTRTENTCISQCESTCSSCTRSAGCSAAADCADAASR